MADKKPTHYIIFVPIDGEPHRIYFFSHSEARTYASKHGRKGEHFHIYPVDNTGFTSKSKGRTSIGAGNWQEKSNQD
jgi:phage-related protein